jgi:hypothetical protein
MSAHSLAIQANGMPVIEGHFISVKPSDSLLAPHWVVVGCSSDADLLVLFWVVINSYHRYQMIGHAYLTSTGIIGRRCRGTRVTNPMTSPSFPLRCCRMGGAVRAGSDSDYLAAMG